MSLPMEISKKSIQDNIVQSSISVIDQIDVKTVKEAVLNMKPNKRDSVYDVTSDMYQHGPDIFFEHLTTIIQQSLVHGFLPFILHRNLGFNQLSIKKMVYFLPCAQSKCQK